MTIVKYLPFSVRAELQTLFLKEGVPNGRLYLSRISEAISCAAGEFSHQLIAPDKDIALKTNELAIVGTITWK